MKDEYQAQYQFWSGFGIPAYEENAVPDADDISFPYLTYQAINNQWDESSQIFVNIWTRSTSWEQADTLALAVKSRMENGGATAGFTGGMIWFTPGTSFIQNMGDPEDNMIRRKLLTVHAHF